MEAHPDQGGPGSAPLTEAALDPAGTPCRSETQARAEGAVMSRNPRVLAQIGWFAGPHHSFTPVALHALRIIDNKRGNNSSRRAVIGGEVNT